jgi:hypothetical protein
MYWARALLVYIDCTAYVMVSLGKAGIWKRIGTALCIIINLRFLK